MLCSASVVGLRDFLILLQHCGSFVKDGEPCSTEYALLVVLLGPVKCRFGIVRTMFGKFWSAYCSRYSGPRLGPSCPLARLPASQPSLSPSLFLYGPTNQWLGSWVLSLGPVTEH